MIPAQLQQSLAGRYVIERELGRGGMATVYLARDLRHGRPVALKVLDPELGAVLGADRFLGEIRVTANLQHPNLLPLFDSGEADGLLYYVMPYVAGESLRARLERERQLPVEEALRIASAVAAALDHAHRHGVIHRDLKPDNILLQDGQPVVADFGIALAVSRAGGARVTQTGLSLGTPQYMSPEQATGDRVIDARSDVYSLGCVLYEMLAGEPPHTGATVQAVIARMLTDPAPSVRVLRPTVPEHVDAALRRALEKIPADRFATAGAFASALGAPALEGRGAAPPAAGRRRRARTLAALPWVVAAVSLGAAGAAAWAWRRAPRGEEVPVVRFAIGLGDRDRVSPMAPSIPFSVSDDDRTIVYIGGQISTGLALFTRPLDRVETRQIAGTEGFTTQPALSPDGKWVAFVRDRSIQKAPLDGGRVETVTAAPGGTAGIDWVTPDTMIVSAGGALVAVPAAGGTPRVLSRPDSARDELAQLGPHVAPDGRCILYIAAGREGIASNRLASLSLRTGRRTLGPAGVTALGVLDGRALWVTVAGAVMAAAVDADGAVTGDPVQVLDGVLVGASGAAKAALSPRGTLVYQSGTAETELVLVDHRGTATALPMERRAYSSPRFSPDGRRIAVTASTARGSDVWIYDVGTRTMTPLTGGGFNTVPEWSADGRRVIFRAVDSAGATLRWMPADGSGPAEVVAPAALEPQEGVLTPDARTLLVRTERRDIVAVPIPGPATPRPIAQAPFSEMGPRLSADGRWLAYLTDETGRVEVYVRPFPGPGGRVRVSTGGGAEPVWTRDGTRLLYRSGRSVVAATLAPGPAVARTDTLFEGSYLSNVTHASYDVAPDGRLLMVRAAVSDAPTVVIYNWGRELAARLGGRR